VHRKRDDAHERDNRRESPPSPREAVGRVDTHRPAMRVGVGGWLIEIQKSPPPPTPPHHSLGSRGAGSNRRRGVETPHDMFLRILIQASKSPATKRRAASVFGAVKKVCASAASTTRPLFISTISPPSLRASPRSCVAITTLMPRAAMPAMMSSVAL